MRGAINPGFWAGKRVFLTGHTGFKGSWASILLADMGAHVKGYALTPPTSPALFEEARVAEMMESQVGDIRDPETLRTSMMAFNPDIVIHMAAQPLVRLSFREPVQTYSTNVMGTVHVLEAARACPNLRAVLNVTSDKCYENREWEWGYREHEPMGGFDPYSNSKGCAELVTSAYRRSFFADPDGPQLASGRAGNVIGGGDWADDRLIPDALRSFPDGTPVVIRNPQAIRPWQHVLEPIGGYLVLVQALYEHGAAYADGWNFGPQDEDARPVSWILDRLVQHWGEDAAWTLDTGAQPHEARFLKLDVSKAATHLGWHPTWGLEEVLGRIVRWHRAYLQGDDMRSTCLAEIKDYLDAMSKGRAAA